MSYEDGDYTTRHHGAAGVAGQMTELEQIGSNLHSLIGRLITANDKIEGSLMRISGSWPAEVNSRECAPDTDGHLAMINALLASMADAVEMTEGHASKLKQI